MLLRFWPAIMQRAQQEAYRRPLNSAGWGCLITLIVFFGVPLAFLLVVFLAIIGGMFTFGQLFNDILGLGSAVLSLIATSFLMIFPLVKKAVVGYLDRRITRRQVPPKMVLGFRTEFVGLAVGVILHELLRSIPVLGWFFEILVILIVMCTI